MKVINLLSASESQSGFSSYGETKSANSSSMIKSLDFSFLHEKEITITDHDDGRRKNE